MGYLFIIIVSGLFLSGYFTGVDAAIGTNCTTGGDGDCDNAGNNEVCDTGATDMCVCDAGYTDNSGTCDPVDCGALTAPAHGSVDTSTGTTFPHQAAFDCDAGYSPDLTATSDCQDDSTWSVTSHTCTIKDCGAVSDPVAGTTALDSAGVTTYGATATVTCDAGFGLDTDTATATITCQAAGSWSALPACTSGDAANCGAPSAPDNGVISTAATANTEGHEATVACDTGYTLVGASTMTCQYDDTWSTPGTCSGSTSATWSFSVVLILAVMVHMIKE